jgi:hypothetical protein
VAGPASASAASPAPKCVVPHLIGDTLAVARHELHRRHCALGTVHEPRTHRLGVLVVRSQGVPAGRTLVEGARVSVALRASPE